MINGYVPYYFYIKRDLMKLRNILFIMVVACLNNSSQAMEFYGRVKKLTADFIHELENLDINGQLESAMQIERFNEYLEKLTTQFTQELKEADLNNIREALMTQFTQELKELGIENTNVQKNKTQEKFLTNIISTMSKDLLTITFLMMGYMNVPRIVPNGEKVECTARVIWVEREELHKKFKCLQDKRDGLINALALNLGTPVDKVKEAIYHLIAKRSIKAIEKMVEISIKLFGRALMADAFELYTTQLYALYDASKIDLSKKLDRYGHEDVEIQKMFEVQKIIEEATEFQASFYLEFLKCPIAGKLLLPVTPQERRRWQVFPPEEIIKFIFALFQNGPVSKL